MAFGLNNSAHSSDPISPFNIVGCFHCTAAGEIQRFSWLISAPAEISHLLFRAETHVPRSGGEVREEEEEDGGAAAHFKQKTPLIRDQEKKWWRVSILI